MRIFTIVLSTITMGLAVAGCDDEPVIPTPDVAAETTADASDVAAEAEASTDVDAGPETDAVGEEVGGELPPTDDGEGVDGSDAADAEVTPDVPTDVGPSGCDVTGCDPGLVCAPGGACVTDCAVEYPTFDNDAVFGALAPGWDVVGMHCGGNIGISAFAPLNATTVLELVRIDGVAESTLVVDKVSFGATAQVEVVAMSTVAAPEWFSGQRLKVDPSGEVVGYGYTEAFAAGFAAGEVGFASLLAPGSAPTFVEASSNYDLASIDKDNWLVAGRSVNNVGSENGVYMLELAGGSVATRVVGGLGFASGNVAAFGESVLMGGFADPWPSMCGDTTVNDGQEAGNKVFFTTLTELGDAKTNGAPVDGFCEAVELAGIASDFSFLDDGRVISGNKWNGELLTVHTLAVDGVGAPSISDDTPLATSDVLEFAKGVPGSGGQIMIQTGAGYMLVAPSVP